MKQLSVNEAIHADLKQIADLEKRKIGGLAELFLIDAIKSWKGKQGILENRSQIEVSCFKEGV